MVSKVAAPKSGRTAGDFSVLEIAFWRWPSLSQGLRGGALQAVGAVGWQQAALGGLRRPWVAAWEARIFTFKADFLCPSGGLSGLFIASASLSFACSIRSGEQVDGHSSVDPSEGLRVNVEHLGQPGHLRYACVSFPFP